MIISNEDVAPKPKRAGPLHGVLWVLGGLFVLAGVGEIIVGIRGASRAYSAAMGVISLVVGFLIIPSTFAMAGQRVRQLKPWYARVLLILAVIIGGTALTRQMPGAPPPKAATQEATRPSSAPTPDEAPPKAATVAASEPKSDPGEKWSDAAFVKDYVGKRLKDPDSAKFKDVWAFRSGPKLAYCGQVNSKNGFGGYSGFEPFVIADEGFAIGDAAILPALKVCEGGTRTSVPLE